MPEQEKPRKRTKKETPAKTPIAPRYLRSEEAAAFLGIDIETLKKRVQRRKIPFIREGGRLLRFDINDLIAWMEKNKTQPRETP